MFGMKNNYTKTYMSRMKIYCTTFVCTYYSQVIKVPSVLYLATYEFCMWLTMLSSNYITHTDYKVCLLYTSRCV